MLAREEAEANPSSKEEAATVEEVAAPSEAGQTKNRYCYQRRVKRIFGIRTGRGPGRDGSDGIVASSAPPRGIHQSYSNFQGAIRAYGRIYIYKVIIKKNSLVKLGIKIFPAL